ncbi:MAG: N-acetyl-gamma-glutamyl-phosphate reductase [Arcobacter sp.]|jgi:N-acetyl-gamma-glutamyl-phosphate reductase|uniref:N-acetyl-gamma-glutamyl-phosphate reductase n=1 Tax=Poseidonibacter ostreae TaxID=2654171 RepID=UPI000C8BC191|nr:N-acetyl-gamma-glutamyl-phosphate reductase [Poseidonibacter ostreae]KAB7885679.1 N-acetyl-gamma-glutamyl-phosphate reductase [Poseidonibacter ostreae]MAC83166.1 N-acetyl-gamma-glutamyl-phosphate reductase [Arcobacter sp.]|tara:strand:- start:5555 stop:6559 length:1005 start_codon:yes stop_codon:yes gene_type:complete
MNVAIIGASGYTGLELIKLLLTHPKFNITYIANSTGEENVQDLHPCLKDVVNIDVSKANAKEVAKVADLAFLALPHKTSMFFAKELLELDVKVVDLSADYRLELDTYEEHYCPHEDKAHIKDSVYGLPEYYSEEIKNSKLVANPGCYPTATLLALLPFVDFIQEGSQIFIDAKSGVSGAGKKLSEVAHFVNLNENSHAYNPFKHRHMPEIQEKIKLVKNKEFQINFVPHLLPVTRGMLVSVYATLKDEIDVEKILEDTYLNNEFVRVRKAPVDLKMVAGTNFCDIFVARNGKALFINSSIDNLLRGASSQAVVNANIMCGFEENEGIPKIAYVP